MIKQTLNLDQLEALRKKLGFKDPGIFEKCVYAFNLLSDVLQAYPNLVFKGGTSILLHIFPPARLSIDIDILLPPKEKEGLSKKLERVAQDSEWFEGIEEDRRVGKKIPKAHFKFPFTSQFSKVQQYVLLDVVFTESPYGVLLHRDIGASAMAFSGARGVVNVPSVDGLFGDKLTAVSPKTVGISLSQDRNMEFMKQIIDLGELFKAIKDMKELRTAFSSTLSVENGFRGGHYSLDDVFNDIILIAFKYSQSLLRGSDNTFKEIGLMNDGNAKVANHLKEKLSPEDIKIALARIVYIISLLRRTDEGSLIQKVNMDMVKDRAFPEQYKILERLKTPVPEAYFYWAMSFSK
jgi:hypothetical protein